MADAKTIQVAEITDFTDGGSTVASIFDVDGVIASKANPGTFYVVPGDQGDWNEERAAEEDTIFGANFTSNQPTLGSFTVSCNARYRGFAGYNSNLLRPTESTTGKTVTLTQEEGLIYKAPLADTPWDWNEDVVVKVDGTTSTAIEWIDYLFGRVKFVEGTTITAPVTADVEVMSLETYGNATDFDLSQTANITETTSFGNAQANGGWQENKPSLREGDISLNAFYRHDSEYKEQLRDGDTVLVEIQLDGDSHSFARGIYRVSSVNNSGGVGGDETSSVDLVLSVPNNVEFPFAWHHDAQSTIPTALKTILTAWERAEPIVVEYYPFGTDQDGEKGIVWTTDVSLSSSVTGLVEANFTGTGTGAPVSI